MSEDKPDGPFSRFTVGDVISVNHYEGVIDCIGQYGIYGIVDGVGLFCIDLKQVEKITILSSEPKTMGDLRVGDYLQYLGDKGCLTEDHPVPEDISNRVCFVGEDDVLIVDEENGDVFHYSPSYPIKNDWSIYSRS
jgi:hypothetical protein